LHNSYSGLRVLIEDCIDDGGSTSPAGQEAGMHVQHPSA
jgi:hypothetical protein